LSRPLSKKRSNPKLPRLRGTDQPCDAHYPATPITSQPSPSASLAANPFIHRSFPNGQKRPVGERGQGVNWRTAYPRHDTALSVPADTGEMSCGRQQRREGDGIQAQGVGPRRTCRSGSSRGRIIRADRIVLLVIQIRLSYPALSDDPGYLGSRRGKRYLSPREPFFPPPPYSRHPYRPADRFSSRFLENALDPSTWRADRSKKQELFLGTEAALVPSRNDTLRCRRYETVRGDRSPTRESAKLLTLEIIRRTRVFLCDFSIRARIASVVRFAFRSDKLQADADNGTIRAMQFHY